MSSAQAVPPGLERAVLAALAGAEPEGDSPAGGSSNLDCRAVSGGCIANALRVSGPGKSSAFLKWAPPRDPAAQTFQAEADGLRALASTGAVRVPRVLGLPAAGDGMGLLLEWLEPTPAKRSSWRELGAAVAALHSAPVEVPGPGWPAHNFIGLLPQSNDDAGDWPEFWWTRRLAPQIELAAGTLGGLLPRLERLRDALPDLLAGAREEGLSLLHGDLWSGNVVFAREGVGVREPVASRVEPADAPIGALIDPSVYAGHREVDLAMAELFGGFPPAFFEGYQKERPTLPDYPARRPIYQLYYLLVHVNLFGGGYLAGVRNVLGQL
ncbi:MAG: fructosamine kinase family protein [Gemmatimonadota bacterium]